MVVVAELKLLGAREIFTLGLFRLSPRLDDLADRVLLYSDDFEDDNSRRSCSVRIYGLEIIPIFRISYFEQIRARLGGTFPHNNVGDVSRAKISPGRFPGRITDIPETGA